MMMQERTSQNKYWALVVIAAVFEVIWVMGLKHANDWLFWSITIIAILVSFLLLIYTAKKLPTSTAYAVFVGLGTAGTVLCEMTVYKEPFSIAKIALIVVLLIGIIGLKTVTGEHGADGESGQERGEQA